MQHTNNNSFSIGFLIRSGKAINGQVPIYCRITVDGNQSEISTRHYIPLRDWNSATSRVRGNSEAAQAINNTLKRMDSQLTELYWKLVGENDALVTALRLKNMFLGVGRQKKTLLQLTEYCKTEVEKKVASKDRVGKTAEAYKKTHDHVKRFLTDVCKADDTYLAEIKPAFFTDLAIYLAGFMEHNTRAYHLWRIGKMFKIAQANEWIDKNPFFSFQHLNEELFEYHQTSQVYLLPDELQQIEEKQFSEERLQLIKDIFIFACWQGFSFVELEKLLITDIIPGIDGKEWIYTHREKSMEPERVPLLPKAKAIVDKYSNHPYCQSTGKLLPFTQLGNYNWYNKYLKQLGDFCGIKKELSTHAARRTFAIQMLMLGMSMETISKYLGHSNILTTQKFYAKILDIKVLADTEALRKKLSALESPAPKAESKENSRQAAGQS